MTTIISAGTTVGTGIAFAPDTSGNLAFQTQAGANTITVPNATGTAMVTGNLPMFRAALTNNGDQTYTNSYLPFNVSVYNNGGGTFNTSSYYYQVPIAGYYYVECRTYGTSSAGSATMYHNIRKNGSDVLINNGDTYIGSSSGQVSIAPIYTSGLIQCSAGDQIQIWAAAYNSSAVYRIYTGASLFSVMFLG